MFVQKRCLVFLISPPSSLNEKEVCKDASLRCPWRSALFLVPGARHDGRSRLAPNSDIHEFRFTRSGRREHGAVRSCPLSPWLQSRLGYSCGPTYWAPAWRAPPCTPDLSETH